MHEVPNSILMLPLLPFLALPGVTLMALKSPPLSGTPLLACTHQLKENPRFTEIGGRTQRVQWGRFWFYLFRERENRKV